MAWQPSHGATAGWLTPAPLECPREDKEDTRGPLPNPSHFPSSTSSPMLDLELDRVHPWSHRIDPAATSLPSSQEDD